MWRKPVGEGAKRVTMESIMSGAGRMRQGRWCIAGTVHN
jgi:hypothetical protein